MVAFSPVSPLPGGPPGIEGVVLHQGEFLPVLDWAAVPGCGEASAPSVAMAVLWPRLGLPLERLMGTLESPLEGCQVPPENDTWSDLVTGFCRVEDRDLPLLDPDRLLALLYRLRTER